MAISRFFVSYWWAIFGVIFGSIYALMLAWKRSPPVKRFMDKLMLKLPIFGPVIEKATLARWTRTLSTMFAAGVPLVEALDSVGPASGNQLFIEATQKIRTEVATGSSLTSAMQNTGRFPSMTLQMTSIGEESGSLDTMLSKVADFYERDVDDAVDAIASLIEPMIMVVLGTLIGGLVIAMYLPIFKLGAVI
jgi:type IV pilus assembly protein PilC